MTDSPNSTPKLILPVALFLMGGLFLVLKKDLTPMENFAPAMAFAFAGAIVMPARYRIWAPLLMVFLTDVILMFRTGYGAGFLLEGVVLVKYVALTAAAVWGAKLRDQKLEISIPGILSRVLACGVAYYFLSNTFAWATSPAYAKDFAGWAQANWTGTPGFPPSWVFLRNSVLSDCLFTLILLCAFNLEAGARRAQTIAWMPDLRLANS